MSKRSEENEDISKSKNLCQIRVRIWMSWALKMKSEYMKENNLIVKLLGEGGTDKMSFLRVKEFFAKTVKSAQHTRRNIIFIAPRV